MNLLLIVAYTTVSLAASFDCKCRLGATGNPCCVQIVTRHVGYATATASARPVLRATTPVRLTVLSSFAVGRVRYVTIAAFQSVLQVIL